MVRATLLEARNSGCRVEVVFCAGAEGRSWLAQLETDSIRYRFAPDIPLAALHRWLADNVLDDHGPTVLHTHFTKFDIAAAFAARGRANVAVFWHIHSQASARLDVRIRNVVKYAVIGYLVKRIFCVAPDIARRVSRLGGSAKRVVYVPNAIDTERFAFATREDRLAARRELGLPLDARILLHLGWDWKRKGGDTFVATVGALSSAGTPVLGVTVGGGELAHSSAAAWGLTDQIRVLDPRNDVRMLYAAADVFLSPSLAEGMPFAMTEALCTGLAVVGSNIPGQAVIAEDISACRLTALEPRALASAVRTTLARDMATVTSEGRTAHLEVVRRFDLKPWAKRMVKYYMETEVCLRRPQ